jgi:energy-coupling factor transporter ATP-binding protein EcfA2
MAHVLICGMSESGKTTLARALASAYRRQGVGVLVLDPLRDPRWNCDFITSNQEEFLDIFWRSRRCMAFLDEGGKSVGRYNYAMQETATMSRHWGHSCHFISQDPTQLAPVVRDQSRHVFLFCSSDRIGKKLADEFNKPELLDCGGLKQGEYIRAARFGGVSRHTFGVTQNASVTNVDRGGVVRGGSGNRTDEGKDEGNTGDTDSGDEAGKSDES